MKSESFEELTKKADKAYRDRDFELAFTLYEELADKNDPSAMFTCGLIMEKGWLGGVKNLDRALDFYRKLALNFDDVEGYLGCVRVYITRREMKSRYVALKYCMEAVSGRQKRLGLLLLGRVYEELFDPPKYKLARRAYIKSFFSGSAWAMRQYSMSLMKTNNVIGGTIMHIIATIVSPIFVFFGGLKTTRDG